MKKTQIYSYYSFGYNYYLLQNVCLDINIHKKDDDSDCMIERIEDFFKFLNDLDLKVTEKAAEPLLNLKEYIKTLPNDAKVDAKLDEKISANVMRIDATLDAELKLKTAYVLTEKRYSTDHLLEGIAQIFAKDVFNSLPDLCKYDFQEAGKAIAFNLPTSAAFHLMRGVESVLRFYYKEIVKQKRVKNQMWGPIIDHLKSRGKPPSKGLIDTLDNIRVNYRNPTQHPEAKYDIDEAQDLLSLSVDAVNKMMKDLKSKSL
jgi:hypothetical protein